LNRFAVEVRVKPRPGLLDPQGKAVHHALGSLGYGAVQSARVGRVIDLEVTAATPDAVEAQVREMCEKLLANPITEDFQIVVLGEVQSS
jgi:phosphoribosylformylglycinamidine synthase subunit PurS